MATLEKRLQALNNLPAIPAVLAQLVALLSDEERDVAEVESIVISDQALSLSVLRTANSVIEGGVEKVTTLREAIGRLGGSKLMQIALAHYTRDALNDAGVGYGLAHGEAWLGALAGAYAAEILAKKMGYNPGMAFTCALLRDCGKLAMDCLHDVEDMLDVMAEADPDDEQMNLERRQFGQDHAEVGAALARVWGLGDEIERAIRYHHSPSALAGDLLVDITYTADLVANHLGYGVGYDGHAYTFDEDALARLNLDRNEFSELLMDAFTKLLDFEAAHTEQGSED